MRVVHLSLSPIDVATGEDGRGGEAPAHHPVAIDLSRPGGWPGRALDPVLVIGELTFHDYAHVSAEVLRFVAADQDALFTDGPMHVQWGNDDASRIPVVSLLPTDGNGSRNENGSTGL